MNPRWTIARRELAGVARERTIVLAILIQVVVAGFSGSLVVGLSAITDPGSVPTRAVPEVAVNRTGIPQDLLGVLRQHGLQPVGMPDDAAAFRAFQEGSVDAVLLVEGSDPTHLTLVLPDGDLRATITLAKLKDALEEHERALRSAASSRLTFEPLYLETDASDGSFSFLYALLIPLLVFLPVILAGALVADSLTEEANRGTLAMLLVTPATAAHVVEGKMLANAALAPALAAAWLGLMSLNGVGMPLAGALGILVIVAAAAVLMGILGSAIALYTRDRNEAQTVYAMAFLLGIMATLLLPVSPVNAVARLAAGSATMDAWLLVPVSVAAATVAWLGLRFALRRPVPEWMQGGRT